MNASTEGLADEASVDDPSADPSMPPTPQTAQGPGPLPPPWDRIFSLGTRIFVWALIFGILYVLRPFFLLVFLTFVFAYILEHGVQGLAHRIANRPARVVLVALVFLGTLITLGVALAPAFQQQARKLAAEYPQYLAKIDTELDRTREQYTVAGNVLPEDLKAIDLIEHLLGFVSTDDVSPEPKRPDETGDMVKFDPDQAGPPVPYPLVSPQFTELRQQKSRESMSDAVDLLKEIASPILGVGSAFLLSLLFSFLIVLDLPKLSRSVVGLANTKVGFIYTEAADNIRDFGRMLGRALEAQLLIALCNTALTALGLWFLGLHANLVFISTIVFFCSFIPVAGVFLSSAPICLEALSQEGFGLMLAAVAMILIVHFIEAYFLNPKIFGHKLHMNAVLVLIVLTIAGKLVGVWGLILGLPIVNYLFGHAIRYRESRQAEVAQEAEPA
jgi:predicted PurR-regulated permease PerM